ncbi:uncharacterized protein LOC116116789 [Pistacia vera]|uniref:uncharacterized protein LOC116116789 n=1 Tax=Pistacia vera TaxID=55513 RepID=UPI001262B655|nr:uncharacterized protein LOC116116789 [Pistacia vera]
MAEELVLPSIDTNSLLYVHPSNTPRLVLVSKQLTGTENYGIWSRARTVSLCAKNKLGFVTGTYTKSLVHARLAPQWERCNSLVLIGIFNSVSREIFNEIVYSTNASQGTNTVAIYFNKLKSLWDGLDSLVSLPAPDSASTKTYLEHLNQQKLVEFLMGLNESYSMVKSQILLMNPLPSVKQAYSVVNQDESQRILAGLNNNADDTVASMTDAKSPNIPVGPVFTSELYNQILELLGKENVTSTNHSVANLAGLLDGTKTHIAHVGYAILDNGMHLSKVLHIPTFRHNLLLVSKFTVSNNYVWGPYRIPTHGNARYFLTLVDDYSRVTCKGIVHQSSCAYSPQQNEVVERKHRHIITVARALKFQSNIPNHLWGYCAQTVVYLINRFPSLVLKGISPFERFFGHPPSLDDIKVFGCLAYATILTPKDKLSPRSTPCVFLGYSLTQKGYFLYDLSSHKVFVTRDVLFHEAIFPFTWTTSRQSPFPFDPEFLDIKLPSTIIALTVPSSTDLLPVVRNAEPTGPPSPSINSSPPQPIIPLRKSSKTKRPPIWTSDFVCPSISLSTSTSAN